MSYLSGFGEIVAAIRERGAGSRNPFYTHWGTLEACLQHYFLSEIINRAAHGLHFVQVKRELHPFAKDQGVVTFHPAGAMSIAIDNLQDK